MSAHTLTLGSWTYKAVTCVPLIGLFTGLKMEGLLAADIQSATLSPHSEQCRPHVINLLNEKNLYKWCCIGRNIACCALAIFTSQIIALAFFLSRICFKTYEIFYNHRTIAYLNANEIDRSDQIKFR